MAGSNEQRLGVTHFDEQRIEEIISGSVPMTCDERNFLTRDTATFEECTHSHDQLAAMDDKDLMNTAYGVWAEYASGQV